jgi:hypothetical protein
MGLVVFAVTYVVSAAIHYTVRALAVGERARSFKAVSPGMLPPLGIIFGLFVAFTATQVWSDVGRASAAVDKEASALKSVLVLAASFPGEPEKRLETLIRSYIDEAASREWPMMAQRTATLSVSPPALNDAMRLTLALSPANPGQQTAQREMTASLETALEARRQRILVSASHVNSVKWACLLLQAICALAAIAVVHSDNRLASALSLGAFATGVAASVLLILSHDEPFVGEVSITPQALLQIRPADAAEPAANASLQAKP